MSEENIDEALLEKLDLCGCASDEILNDFKNVIKMMEDAETNNTVAYYTEIAEKQGLPPQYVELILLWLNRVGIAEHGCAARGSWLTKRDNG